jgi:RNA polymerase sigma-70 factor (ECF subfamily)
MLRKFLARRSILLGWLPFVGVIPMMTPEILSQLVDEKSPALILYARQWCSTPEDVVQEAFIKLAGQQPTPTNLAGWLYCVVRHGAITAARAARRRRHHENKAATNVPSWFLPTEHASLDGETATAALEALPLELREVVVAHLWGGLTFEQIGELAEVSASTAHRRYMTALSTLRERLRVPCPKSMTSKGGATPS